MPSTIGGLLISLEWQERVAAATTNPAQRNRCKAAAERLRAQISEAEKREAASE